MNDVGDVQNIQEISDKNIELHRANTAHLKHYDINYDFTGVSQDT